MLCAANASAYAQGFGDHEERISTTPASALAWNALIGGATSATRAWFGHRDVSKAFMTGVFGGAVHYSGKWVASRSPAFPNGLAGLAISSTGTSIVSNAGAGIRPLDELLYPVGPFRIRSNAGNWSRPHFEVNAFEAAIVARNLARPGLTIDWTRSASSAGLIFLAPDKYIVAGDESVAGVAQGPVAIISGFAQNPDQTTRHEVVHLHQHWFVQDAWGRPIEAELRQRVKPLRRVPRWLQFGVLSPALILLDDALLRGALRKGAVEPEADLLER
jgi:hypothetical protein